MRLLLEQFSEYSAGVGVFNDKRGLNVDEIRPLGRALVHRLRVVSFRQRESSGQVGPAPTANHLDAARAGRPVLRNFAMTSAIFPEHTDHVDMNFIGTPSC